MSMASIQSPVRDGPMPSRSTHRSTSAQQIRSSSFLLVGRVFALGLDFVSQILLVHYLTKADFGAFSYALATVMLFQRVAMFEMSTALSRFVPLYRERQQYGAVFGSIVLAIGLVTGLGVLMAVAISAGLTLLGLAPTEDPQALRLLLILAVLIPLQALDALFTSLFAIIDHSIAIFLRQSLLKPGLKVALVLILLAVGANVVFLAVGYLVISILALLVSIWMFWRALSGQEWLSRRHSRQFSYPTRELLGFATPLLSSTLVWLLMESSDALLLGYFRGAEAVADFRAVLPVAQLNMIVSWTFAVLYTPLAARSYARNDHHELSNLYWQTALWMAVLTCPLFILTVGFANAVVDGLYGAKYAASAPVMALLSLGYFVQTASGFNGLTLKVFKRLRYAVSIDIAAAVLNIGVNLLLIPQWGALGAAAGTAGTMIVHNLLKQVGLWKYTNIPLFRREYARPYAWLFGVPLAALVVQAMIPVGFWVALPAGAVASLLVVWNSRGRLQIEAMFPEVRDWPVVRRILRPLIGST